MLENQYHPSLYPILVDIARPSNHLESVSSLTKTGCNLTCCKERGQPKLWRWGWAELGQAKQCIAGDSRDPQPHVLFEVAISKALTAPSRSLVSCKHCTAVLSKIWSRASRRHLYASPIEVSWSIYLSFRSPEDGFLEFLRSLVCCASVPCKPVSKPNCCTYSCKPVCGETRACITSRQGGNLMDLATNRRA